jgi:NTP pyrophosphatase (non-canonical NTP hydrolase)
MDEINYQNNVLARCSSEWHGNLIDKDMLVILLNRAIATGNMLDEVKKAIFYNREPKSACLGAGLKTCALQLPAWKHQRIIHAILGLHTESVELLEALLKNIEDGTPFDEVNLQEEFGDANWYYTLGLNALSQSASNNRLQNDKKLEARFGPVFNANRANERDLTRERTVLEQGTGNFDNRVYAAQSEERPIGSQRKCQVCGEPFGGFHKPTCSYYDLELKRA